MKLRSFDAFPKVEERRRGGRGAGAAEPGDGEPPGMNPVVKWFTVVAGVFILWLQTTTWMGAHEDYQFSVDKGLTETFEINLDISVKASCEELSIMLLDAAEDHLMVNELVQTQPLADPVDPNVQWCHMYGIFMTNRVRGKLIIYPRTANGWGRRVKPIDLTHYIQELSFGPYYPNMLNPLDETMQQSAGPGNEVFGYHLSIVPTKLQALGAEIDTNLYTVTKNHVDNSNNLQQMPNIYFSYDFDPIAMTVTDARMPFLAWFVRMVNILGGLAIASVWIRRALSPKQPEGEANADDYDRDYKIPT